MPTVKDILATKGYTIWSVAPEATVYQALELMADKDVGALLVLDGGRLVGIFSERDYARKIILKGKASRDTPVRDSMTTRVVTVPPTDAVEDCMALMTDHRVRHLPVLDDGELVGIVSIGDVVKAIISEQGFMIKELENYITGQR
jgi:CBS domain-containing protein